MKIAILYICTGKYNQFFQDFYESCEKFFFNGREKKYFVWTDNLDLTNKSNVELIYKECGGFPKDTIYRFKYFLEKENELLRYDYVFFFNSNMLFIDYVNNEFLPEKKDGYICCLDADYDKHYPHPCFYPYERNKKSLAYIPRGLDHYRYYHGAINGGRVKEYLDLCKTLKNNIDEDYKNNIIAICHDESHINNYLMNRKCKSLHSDLYGLPENSKYIIHPHIIIRDKTKIDKYFLRNRSFTFWGRTKHAAHILFHIIKWYI